MSSARAVPQRTFLGHPLGLYVLFFTEMWERFSFYGMRALLILYMTQYFRWSQKDASTYYKVYTSFVYVTPILGGFLADRYLGNRWAVIIGGVLMAIGHFLMAFEAQPIFLAALIFLIVGNGMFKPNMSTQVGRLYPPNDGRRDGAYTIFYMGINLGAMSPLLLGWLKDNTLGGFHTGFTTAGIGMVLGLVIYLLGQPLIKEIEPDDVKLSTATTNLEGVTASPGQQKHALDAPAGDRPLSEAEASVAPSIFGGFSEQIPTLLYGLAVVLLVLAPVYYLRQPAENQTSAFFDAIMIVTAAGCLGLIGFIGAQVRNALRDRVLAVLIAGVFVMFFWAAFEQAGNVMSLWAEHNTNRNLWKPMGALEQFPEVHEDDDAADGGEAGDAGPVRRFLRMFALKPAKEVKTWGEFFEGIFNPLSTESFQSINAFAIVVIAPIFAALWLWLDRRGLQPSIALKMFFGLVFVMMSVGVMVGAAKQEDRPTTVGYDGQLPAGLTLKDAKVGVSDDKGEFKPFHAGRLMLAAGELLTLGELPVTERDDVLGATAPKAFKDAVKELAEKSKKIDGTSMKEVSLELKDVPPGFDMRFAGLKRSVVRWDPDTKTLTARQELKTRETKGLLTAASDRNFREALLALFVKAGESRVSTWWLFWAYIFATFGELCLSPVGLSMVSKLAPRDYQTMLMGVWMLTSAFGNFAAGLAGEYWGTVTPVSFFTFLMATVGGAALALLMLVRLLVRLMHGVK